MKAAGRVRTVVAVGLSAVLGILGFSAAFAAGSQRDARKGRTASRNVISLEHAMITPVRGPSWLTRLGYTVTATSYGRAGRWGLKNPEEKEVFTETRQGDSFVVTGNDLYRLSCRSCHGADASGVPSEIKSIRGMIRAADSAAVRADMKKKGTPVSAAKAAELAAQGERKLRLALDHPGTKLPPPDHLDAVEIKALLAYLEELAGVPGAQGKQMWIRESAVRVGEHLVKGTCQTCHAATGPGSGEKPIATPGVPPSLASLMQERAVGQVIRKAHQGLPSPEAGAQRGTMPILSYVTSDDLVAAYEYLAAYPPKP